MPPTFSRTSAFISTIALLAALLLAMSLVLGSLGVAQAAPNAGPTCFAEYTGDDVTDFSSANADAVQAAVDAAPSGATVKLAGTCPGVQSRGGVTQTVYINKGLTVRGGYIRTQWLATPDSVAWPTTLDALGLGRVVYIRGTISATVEGLHITGGDASGLDADFTDLDGGGGVYIHEATVTISGCAIYSNTASIIGPGYGGGLWLSHNEAFLRSNTVQDNIASIASWGMGGGLYMFGSDVWLQDNTVQGNTTSTASFGNGGGLSSSSSNIWLQDNTIQDNIASTAYGGSGGGLYAYGRPARLQGNRVQGNIASTADYGLGGGLAIDTGHFTLKDNMIINNTATLSPTAEGWGGGVYVFDETTFSLINNLLAGNQANSLGGGLMVIGHSFSPSSGDLLHTTIADNLTNGISGQGVYVGQYATLALTNTIIAGHSGFGIEVIPDGTATLEGTLWHDNGRNFGGGGTVLIGTVNVYDNPAFVGGSNYHLTGSSAAIDAGVNAGVITDIDGAPRPQGSGYDIGADEFGDRPPAEHRIYLPLMIKNQ
jgi:hypothetical protein